MMNRKQAIEIICKKVLDEPIVSANGFISRDLYEVNDRHGNFYMIGSMGLASSIGLGIALKNPKKDVYVLDGDGNIFMNLGSLSTIGMLKPKNLIHIILDNESHESTGGQPTHSKKIQIDKIATATKHKVLRANNRNGLLKILNNIKKYSRPLVIVIKIENNKTISKRVAIKPQKICDRFMSFLGE